MEYKNNVDYQKKIEEAIWDKKREINILENKIKELTELKEEFEKVKEYSIDGIMPIFKNLIFEMEGKNFLWGSEHRLIHLNHPAYGYLVDVIYLIDEKSDFDKYSYTGKIFQKEARKIGKEDYWDSAQDYVKIVYRDVRVELNYLGCMETTPHSNGMIDFSKNNRISSDEWGCSIYSYDVSFFSRISNPYFKYLLDFIDYCSYWRIVEEYGQSTMYDQIRSLIPSFVKNYKKRNKK